MEEESVWRSGAAWLDEQIERWKKEASAEISGDRLSGSLISADAFWIRMFWGFRGKIKEPRSPKVLSDNRSDKTWTCGLFVPNEALYHLSHTPMCRIYQPDKWYDTACLDKSQHLIWKNSKNLFWWAKRAAKQRKAWKMRFCEWRVWTVTFELFIKN